MTTFRILGASAAALFSAAPALSQEAVPSWTGFYLGAGVAAGYLVTDQYSPPQLGYGGYDAATYAGWHPYGSVQAGYDLQLGDTVLGVRVQQSATNSEADGYWKADELVTANAKAVTTFSARAGRLLQPALLGYVTASVAAGHFNYSSVDEKWDLVDDSLDAARLGLGLGAGVELRLNENLSLFAEYSHTRFEGESTFDYGDIGYPPSWTYEYTHYLGVQQTGLNFRF